MNKRKTLVVNLIAGPGTGKTTMMSSLFAELKWGGVECEVAPEYAKEIVWGENFNILKDQLYIFAEQAHRQFRLKGKVDVILTDSPLIFSLMYGENMTEAFKVLVKEQFFMYDNLNIYLDRVKPYNPNGRTQTFEEAKQLDTQIHNILEENDVPFIRMDATKNNIKEIVNLINLKIDTINKG